MSKLVEGLIPKNTVCPFVVKCSNGCNECPLDHKGLKHGVDYSCAIARAYDLSRKN
jgi:hypothetical protein